MRHLIELLRNLYLFPTIEEGGEEGAGGGAGADEFKPEINESGEILVDLGGKEKPEETEGSDTSEDGDFSYTPEFAKQFEGKSQNELIEQLYNKEQMIGKQGTQINEMKIKTLSARTSKDVKGELTKLESDIDKLDEFADVDSITDLQGKKKLLEREHSDLKQQEFINTHYLKDANDEVSKAFRKDCVEKYNYDIGDEDWATITAYAKSISDKGKISAEDMNHAVSKAIGYEKHEKAKEIFAKTGVRKNIQKASGKKYDAGAGGSNAGGGNQHDIMKMNPGQFQSYLRTLSPANKTKVLKMVENHSKRALNRA